MHIRIFLQKIFELIPEMTQDFYGNCNGRLSTEKTVEDNRYTFLLQ